MPWLILPEGLARWPWRACCPRGSVGLEEPRRPLTARQPHHVAKAKRVIFLFMTGGVSHVDSFDPKPKLIAGHGRSITVDNWQGKLGEFKRHLKRPDWTFRPGGQSGIEVSDLFPRVRSIVDDLCVIRSMATDHTNHYESTLGMHCGSWTFARPSIGAWCSYGLGTTNRNLPSFMVLGPRAPYAGAQTWGSDFLPGCHQGTWVVPGANPIPNLRPRTSSDRLQRLELELLGKANRRHLEQRTADRALEARIRSFETAFGMQREAPEAMDLGRETASTLEMYGIKPGQTSGFGWQCLVARRLAERGVRFIELIDVGSSANWDAHGDMATTAPWPERRRTDRCVGDRPEAAGMLDDTRVCLDDRVRPTPYHEKADHRGREHTTGVQSWMAGGVSNGNGLRSSDPLGIEWPNRRSTCTFFMQRSCPCSGWTTSV
ncbi:MAG: hypothetical protein CM1200mP2_51530 [Planctomycetaceae bacterium]|nr:MAG: hypothetical protein CM1200mP2_51530 [Planctomycetaceae bacterium]